MGKGSVFSSLYDQFGAAPPLARADLKGKTVIVVGANTGLGFEATQHFATMGCEKLILACRSQEKGEAAIQRLAAATSYSQAELWLVDLADFLSVRNFIDRALKELERLDILLLNAAIAPAGRYNLTKDGWEETIQVNNISISLLALRLLPHMFDTAKKFRTTPRLVIVSSDVHFWTTLEDKAIKSSNTLKLLSDKEYCTPKIFRVRYLDSKLLNVFFARALNSHLKDQSIIVNTVNPAFCYSELRRGRTGIGNSLFEWLFARTAEEGSRQLVFAAVGVPEGPGGLETLKGGYIHMSRVTEPSDFVLGEDGKKREDKLWDDLLAILRDVDPHVGDVVSQYLV
ncbi:WW domain-containing oxidoreductase [Leucoagaricus sp. SymC.cos]|nr:WW domain-containing oxidoreductase [Leucoagaricus sp. SymC.cos]